MKKTFLLTVLLLLITALPVLSEVSEKELTVVYTGNVWGKITPCPS